MQHINNDSAASEVELMCPISPKQVMLEIAIRRACDLCLYLERTGWQNNSLKEFSGAFGNSSRNRRRRSSTLPPGSGIQTVFPADDVGEMCTVRRQAG